MSTVARTAIIVVVIIIVVAFFVFVVLPNPPPISGGGGLPPDPSLPGFIKAVQAASAALAATTSSFTAMVDGLAGEVSTTFGAYDSGEGVSDSAPAGLRKGAADAISTAQQRLGSYAQEVASFDKKVQSWTVDTSPYPIMQEKPTATAVQFDVTKPMADFLNAEGQISSLVSAWTAAYEAASEGNKCGHSSDDTPCRRSQSCVRGRCAASMNGTMQGAINALSSAAGELKTNGTLNTSPWQQAAENTNQQYIALYNHLAGV